MAIAVDHAASAGRYVWQPDDSRLTRSAGSVTWVLRLPLAGRYWLWGRVLAPDGEHDSFDLRITGAEDQTIASGAWHTRRDPKWAWCQVALDKSKTPIALDLPAGLIRIELRAREPGTKIDRLLLTADPQARPE